MEQTVIKREKPRIFVGSSTEGLQTANAIQLLLEHDAEVTVWTQGVFEASSNSLDDLIEILDKIDFGVFVFSPDDISKIRQKKYLVARDNVIFEMGLFVGRLGKKRTLYVVPRERTNFHLPSDLIGVSPLDYDSNRSDGNIQAALGSACTKIRQRINQLGRFETKVPIVEHKANQETSVFTIQEESEFNYIYEKLKPIRYASIEIFKKETTNEGRTKNNKIGRCIFKYLLIKVIWLNINKKNNSFSDFLYPYWKEMQEIIPSKLPFFDSDHSVGFNFEPNDDLVPLLRMSGLLEEVVDNSSRQLIPGYTYYVYSDKMFRFFYWMDYNKKISDETAIEFVEFIKDQEEN